MTTKADFNADEWTVVTRGPALAGLRVIAADRGGTVRESISMGQAYQEARAAAGDGLLAAIIAAPPQLDPAAARETMQAGVTQELRAAVATLTAKATPDEVEGYKTFVLDVAETVAKAHKEGGFLGVGGQEISEAERGALEEIAAALGVNYAA